MRNYPAKLLLLGEHVILHGAPALSLPVPAFTGRWGWRDTAVPPDERDLRLREFAQSTALLDTPGIQARAFAADLAQGLFFDANIPEGYGLGSSGALCAAVYDRYATEKQTDPALLKSIFAGMESFFHGNSSGLDPLTSFLNRPLLVTQQNQVECLDAARWVGEPPLVFLLDSQLPRRTGPLVAWFREQTRARDFAAFLHNDYVPTLEQAVLAYRQGQSADFMAAMRRISGLQLEYMRPLIPPSVLPAWQEALRGDTTALKICGAGGGGFVLGFTTRALDAGRLSEGFPWLFPFAQPALLHENAA